LRPFEVERIVLTHHHVDHVSGASALAQRLRSEGRPAPVVAHPETRTRVPGCDVDCVDGDVLDCGGRRLVALHTPGHAPGHLAFHDADSGAVVAGDLVAGVGTIVLEPSEGDLAQYLASLERVRALSPSVLLPAHGPALTHPKATLTTYIAHRHLRTQQFHEALDRLGTATPMEIARVVYDTLDPMWLPVAAAQVETHLRWMEVHGLCTREGDAWLG
jgi:glyoxylase-like metal-dependent hydrolase (beta-lactamase superfamily II)